MDKKIDITIFHYPDQLDGQSQITMRMLIRAVVKSVDPDARVTVIFTKLTAEDATSPVGKTIHVFSEDVNLLYQVVEHVRKHYPRPNSNVIGIEE